MRITSYAFSPRSGLPGIALLAALGVAACDPGPAGPPAEDAGFYVGVAMAGFAHAGPDGDDGSEPREVACPAGGHIRIEGSQTHHSDGEVSIHTWDQVVGHDACGLSVNGAPVTIDGEIQRVGEARFGAPVQGVSPLLMMEATQVGTLSVTRAGVTTTCSYDLVFEFDAAADQYRITGTACGHAVDMRAPGSP